MDVKDRVPAHLLGSPGQGLDNARDLLSVLANLTTADVEAQDERFGMGVFHIANLAQDLIEYEQTYNLSNKGGD